MGYLWVVFRPNHCCLISQELEVTSTQVQLVLLEVYVYYITLLFFFFFSNNTFRHTWVISATKTYLLQKKLYRSPKIFIAQTCNWTILILGQASRGNFKAMDTSIPSSLRVSSLLNSIPQQFRGRQKLPAVKPIQTDFAPKSIWCTLSKSIIWKCAHLTVNMKSKSTFCVHN